MVAQMLATTTTTAEWLGVAGTVGAVIAALWLQLVLPWWLRPKLEIPYKATPHPVPRDDGVWWDIPVVNRGRGSTAIAAQAMLTRVTRPNPQTPIALRSLRWTHVNDEARVEVPAGIERWVELGKKRSTERYLVLGLHPPIDDPPRMRLDEAGEYTFELALVARNATARNYSFVVTFEDGGGVRFGEIVAEPLRSRLRRAVATGLGLRRLRPARLQADE